MTQPSLVSFLSASCFPFPFRCFPGSSPKASPCISVLVSVSALEGIRIRNLPLFLQKVPLVGCELDILLRMNPQIHQIGRCPPNFSQCSAPLRLSPLRGPKALICWSSFSQGPAEGSSPASAPGNWQHEEMHRMSGCFPVIPGPPATWVMVIQARLNEETFSFSGVPGQSQWDYLPPRSPLVQDDGLNISSTSRK